MPRTLLLIGLTLALFACDPTGARPTATPGATNPAGDTALVTFVFDGDSFEAQVNGQQDEVRLLGINAPEAGECHGDEARDALETQLEAKEVVLVRGSSDDRDDFGRLLRYAYVDGRNINEAMLFHGQAVALQSDHDLNDGFVRVMEEAAGEERGMWERNACGSASRRAVAVAWVEFNPPGPDDEVLNDEYVEIVNEGSLRVDLAGWTLRDESSQNRYVFDRTLRSDHRILVRTGCGNDRGEDVYWCSERSIWSNGGDTAILQDEHGNVVSWRTYQGG